MKKYKIRKGSIADKITRRAVPVSLSVALMVGAMGTMTVAKNCSMQVEAMDRIENEPVAMTTVTAQAPVVNVSRHYDIPLAYDFQDYVAEKCVGTGITPTLVYAMVECESGYQTDVIGDNGHSVGLMQIQQRWHQADMDAVGANDLTDPYDNVATGIYILSSLIQRGNGECWAVTAYNAGPAVADKYMQAGELSEYFIKVKATQTEIERSRI